MEAITCLYTTKLTLIAVSKDKCYKSIKNAYMYTERYLLGSNSGKIKPVALAINCQVTVV